MTPWHRKCADPIDKISVFSLNSAIYILYTCVACVEEHKKGNGTVGGGCAVGEDEGAVTGRNALGGRAPFAAARDPNRRRLNKNHCRVPETRPSGISPRLLCHDRGAGQSTVLCASSSCPTRSVALYLGSNAEEKRVTTF